MEGIDILNQTEIMVNPLSSYLLILFFIIAFLVGLIMLSFINSRKRFGIFGIVLIILSIISCVFAFAGANTEHTGRYRYEVTIDDGVSFLDLQEEYDVIEQNGRIWTLEDKETEE